MANEESSSKNFLEEIIEEDIRNGKWDGKVCTRFPPEPNGYLHLGHAASICLNFGLAKSYGGTCHLRFDDTNPVREDVEYVDSIMDDVRWLGFDWGDNMFYASDYFDQLYAWAIQLIQDGKAFVCDLDADSMRTYRGTLKEPGKNSPNRDRSVEENLDLFQRMRAGEFADGTKTLRAKVDMAHPNLNMRDPVMYRILHAHHHRTGDTWCIYPTYDWTHGQSDSLEGITHSICTLEFENHRPLYDWFIEQLGIHHSRQYEFGRRNITYTVVSKRKLLQLVSEGHVSGWDDPRMPTLRGMRRRGYTAASIRSFCEKSGIARFVGTNEIELLEHCLREDLNQNAERRMGVLNPLKVVITNYPDDQVEEIEATNNPNDDSAGTRTLPFSRELWIERDDFMENPPSPKKFYGLGPGREVRLRYTYYITCQEYVKDPETGEVTELHCTYDPETADGSSPDGRRVRGTIHWVSAKHACDADIRLYDRLFSKPNPEDTEGDESFTHHLNPDSLEILNGCKLEPSLKDADPEVPFQFERKGYFCLDHQHSSEGTLTFNRTATLRDSYGKKKK